MALPPKKVVPKAPPAPMAQKLPTERAIVVFDYNLRGRIIFCQGVTIEPEARHETALEYHGITSPDGAKPGSVWVYECEPVQINGTVSHKAGAWREPKAQWEMASFHTGSFVGIWPDIPAGEESAKIKAQEQEEMLARITAGHEAEMRIKRAKQ
jgi:hypothetical protein